MAYSRARHLSTILLASGRVKRAASNWGDGTNAITLANLPTITNAKLDNASVTINSVATALGTSADENIQDLVGAMFSSNTETGVTVTYEDGDGTIDLVIGTLNQNTTGSAATLTTARTIGGTSFDGSANIAVALAATATALASARTIGGVSFDGTANINLPGVNAVGSQNTTGSAATLTTARTIGGVSFDGSANINLPGVNAAGNQNTTGTATLASNVNVIANNTNDETTYIGFVDGATGSQSIETDTGLTYNPSTGLLTSAGFAGPITGAVTGNATTATTATLSTNVTATANNSANETVYPTFVDGATGSQGIETDTGLTYNPSTGVLTTTQLTGNVTGTITGNVTGNVTGNLLGTPTAPTASANTNTTQVATTAYVQTELTDLINGAPGTLDTLNELAAAINDDANYNSTLTTALATKLPLAGGTLTGNISHASNFTLDVAASITLDSDSGVIDFDDGGTNIGRFENASSDFKMESRVQDKDIVLVGNDGGTGVEALRLDMSNAGAATFNYSLLARNEIWLNNTANSKTIGYLYDSSDNFVIRSYTGDKDIIFKGNDGGSIISALTLDM